MTEVRDTIWGDDQLPLVLMAYPIPAEGTPDYYAVDLLNTALAGGQSSRLNRAVVDDQELAVFCAFFGLEDPAKPSPMPWPTSAPTPPRWKAPWSPKSTGSSPGSAPRGRQAEKPGRKRIRPV